MFTEENLKKTYLVKASANSLIFRNPVFWLFQQALDIYLLQMGIDYQPTGSMTLESPSGLVKREADKSYKLGPNREFPDLAVEVVVTSAGINKLEAYKRLQIPEVWFWENGALRMYSLGADGYAEVDRSFVLPDLDIVLLVRCINIENHLQAMREFKQAIQSS